MGKHLKQAVPFTFGAAVITGHGAGAVVADDDGVSGLQRLESTARSFGSGGRRLYTAAVEWGRGFPSLTGAPQIGGVKVRSGHVSLGVCALVPPTSSL